MRTFFFSFLLPCFSRLRAFLSSLSRFRFFSRRRTSCELELLLLLPLPLPLSLSLPPLLSLAIVSRQGDWSRAAEPSLFLTNTVS